MSQLFNGHLKIRLIEAIDIRPTEWNSYVNVDCDDEYHIGQSSTKPKTNHPIWNEEFQHEVHDGKILGFSLFHDCALPPDDFVANSRLYFSDLNLSVPQDVWIDLEPHGRLHVVIEMKGKIVTEG